MDSRIREIEQWIAEAKQDLGECGREAYINKLYLLDAEIRAIIKEDGSLPAANSPKPRDNNVRRLSLPTTAVAAAVGVLLLAASTAYFTSRSTHSELLASAPPVATGQRPAASRTQPHVTPAGYIPKRIPGEEILPANWEPDPIQAAAEIPAQPVVQEAPVLAAAGQPAAGGPATLPTAMESGSGNIGDLPAVAPVHTVANQATEIALAAYERPAPGTPRAASDRPNGNPNNTSLGGEIERTIATEVPTDKPEELLEGPDDRGFYDQWTVDNGDNSIEELVDELEETEPELNSTELAEILREALDPRKDS